MDTKQLKQLNLTQDAEFKMINNKKDEPDYYCTKFEATFE